jgi:ATPase subunit of ABC transporter with duplicated ATPase domains
MLLLDEPTNHLDAESVAWLQHHLEAFPGCVILVTHDRYFLDLVTKWTLELDRGKGHPHEGNYSSWLEAKTKRVVQEQSESEARQRALTRELDWVRSGAKARQAKSKARLAAYERMVAEQEKHARQAQTHAVIQIPPGPRLGNVVLEAERPGEGVRRQGAVQGPVVQAAAQRHRGRHRPERRRQVDAVPPDHRPGDSPDGGSLKRRRDGQAGLRRPEP